VTREPQEIEDEEYEQVLGRAAAIDVARATGMVCTRVPHPSRPGRRMTKFWNVDAHHERDSGTGRVPGRPGDREGHDRVDQCYPGFSRSNMTYPQVRPIAVASVTEAATTRPGRILGRLSDCTGEDRQVRACGASTAFRLRTSALSRTDSG
jgi:hypothetical protein